MKKFAVLLCAILLAGCQSASRTAEVRPAPEPDPNVVVTPATDVPADYAAFSGIWMGSWGGALDGNIAVAEISPSGEAKVVYAWGDHPDGRFLRGAGEVAGKITDGKLSLTSSDGSPLAVYTMRPDGRLDGHYVKHGASTKGIFTRQ